MKDPFDILRAELVAAAERAKLAAPRKWSGWHRRPSRPVAIFLVALVIAGSAAAAVLSLSSSQPLVGRVPGAVTPASLAGYSYTIAVTPGYQSAGRGAGWDSWIVYSRRGTSGYGGVGGGFAPGIQRPRTPSSAGGPAGSSARVAARHLYPRQHRRVRPNRPTGVGRPDWEPNDPHYQFSRPAERRSSRRLLRPRHRARPVVFIPGLPTGPPPGKHPPGMNNIHTIRIVPLDRSGQVIATSSCAAPSQAPPVTWLAPDAVRRWWPLNGFTVPYQGPGYHAPPRPRPGVCELAQHGLPALHVQFGHTVAWISPVNGALGEVFLSCVDAEYYLDGWPLQVGVLLDGHRPGQVLGPIPGARPVPGQPEIVNLATGQFPSSLFSRNFGVTAKRVGNAWLVAQGGSGLAQRVQVLNALRISKLDLHHVTP